MIKKMSQQSEQNSQKYQSENNRHLYALENNKSVYSQEGGSFEQKPITPVKSEIKKSRNSSESRN